MTYHGCYLKLFLIDLNWYSKQSIVLRYISKKNCCLHVCYVFTGCMQQVFVYLIWIFSSRGVRNFHTFFRWVGKFWQTSHPFYVKLWLPLPTEYEKHRRWQSEKTWFIVCTVTSMVSPKKSIWTFAVYAPESI